MDSNQEQPEKVVVPEYLPPTDAQQQTEPQPAQVSSLDQSQQLIQPLPPSGEVLLPSRYNVSHSTARLAVILLGISASVVAVAVLSFISPYTYFIAGILSVAALVVIVAYIIVRRAYVSLAMYVAAIATYMVSSASSSYDFVSSMSQLIMYIAGPLLLAATVLLLVDAYRVTKAQSASAIRSSRLRIALFVVAVLGSIISVGAVVFMMVIYLSARACELSGSSKCM